MTGPAQFRDTWYAIAPPWLRTGTAEKYMFVLQYMSDLLCEKANQAIRIRIPGAGDVSQLPYLANDRALVQGPQESAAAFLLRIKSAIPDWKIAGSRRSILRELQAYATGLNAGVSGTRPEFAIVGDSATLTTWHTIHIGDAQGTPPTLATVQTNFNWDGSHKSWRAWLIMYMTSVAVGPSGSAASTTTARAGSLLGHLVNGVWVPQTSGTPVNSPWLTITGLSGLSSANVGQWLVLSGSSHSGNNGVFYIDSVSGPTSCVIANPSGVTSDAGPMTWSVVKFPWIGPGPVWGASGVVFGQGMTSFPPVLKGSIVGSAWVPPAAGQGYGTSFSWGLSVSFATIDAIRQIVRSRKSASTYYPNFVVLFGAPGTEYLPTLTAGGGNPDGTFGPLGKLAASGAWVPTRKLTSPYDCYVQGTGIARACGIENIT